MKAAGAVIHLRALFERPIVGANAISSAGVERFRRNIA
jgi:hypothetical protein